MPEAPTCVVKDCLHESDTADRLTLPDGHVVLIPWCGGHVQDPVRDMVCAAIERDRFLPNKGILIVDEPA